MNYPRAHHSPQVDAGPFGDRLALLWLAMMSFAVGNTIYLSVVGILTVVLRAAKGRHASMGSTV